MNIKITLTDALSPEDFEITTNKGGKTEISIKNIKIQTSMLATFNCRDENGRLLDDGFISLTRNGTIKLSRIK